jgi:hypothetical protein
MDGTNIKIWTGCLRNSSPIPSKARDLSHTQNIQTESGTQTASYSVGTRDSFPGVKRLGCEADCSLPSSAKVKNERVYTSTHPYIFKACTDII